MRIYASLWSVLSSDGCLFGWRRRNVTPQPHFHFNPSPEVIGCHIKQKESQGLDLRAWALLLIEEPAEMMRRKGQKQRFKLKTVSLRRGWDEEERERDERWICVLISSAGRGAYHLTVNWTTSGGAVLKRLHRRRVEPERGSRGSPAGGCRYISRQIQADVHILFLRWA